ncbi:MAG: acriflavine resistance protein B [bacterium]|nr:MAG: acriflavine resistance protein B [bacterium]
MTSIATMMAAVPPALGLGPGSEIRTPMAIGIIGGIVVSTTLSLFVVPTFFVAADKLSERVKVMVRRRSKGEVGQPAR